MFTFLLRQAKRRYAFCVGESRRRSKRSTGLPFVLIVMRDLEKRLNVLASDVRPSAGHTQLMRSKNPLA